MNAEPEPIRLLGHRDIAQTRGRNAQASEPRLPCRHCLPVLFARRNPRRLLRLARCRARAEDLMAGGSAAIPASGGKILFSPNHQEPRSGSVWPEPGPNRAGALARGTATKEIVQLPALLSANRAIFRHDTDSALTVW